MLNKKLVGVLLLTMLSLSACKSEVKAYRMEGISALEKGDAEKALENFDLALEKSKGRVGSLQFDILSYKVEAEIHLGKLKEAEEDLKNVEALSGKNYEKLQNRIDAKKLVYSAGEALNEDDVDKARASLDEAKEKGLSADRELEFNEAVYLEKTGEWQKAYDAFSQYCSRYPDDEKASRELSFLESRKKALEGNTALSETMNKAGKRHNRYKRKYRVKREFTAKRHNRYIRKYKIEMEKEKRRKMSLG